MAYIKIKISYIRNFFDIRLGKIDKLYEYEEKQKLTNDIDYEKLKYFITNLSNSILVDNHMILDFINNHNYKQYRYCRYNTKFSAKKWVLLFIMDAIYKFGINEFIKLYTLLYNIYYETDIEEYMLY